MTEAATQMLAAIIAMGLLHFLMTGWLYVTRIMAMKNAGLTTATVTMNDLRRAPKWAANPAANYNNLTEAPPLFYAVSIAIILLGQADSFYVVLAWLYVALRVAHSLWQALINIISVRMVLFIASWLVLGAMIIRTGLTFFH